MTLVWSANLTQADSNAAGFANDNWNQQTQAGDGVNAGLVFPLPILSAPDGVRSVQVSLPSRGKRNEIQPNVPDFGAGVNYYFSQQFYLPTGFDVTASAGAQFQVIEQMRQADNAGSPVVAFEIRNGSLLLTGGYGVQGASPPNQYQYSQTLLPTVAIGRRYSLIYRLGPLSTTPGASTIDVWIDGTQILSNFVISSPTLIGGSTYRKQGLYRDSGNATVETIWQSGQGIGTTYADVAALITVPPSGSAASLSAISKLTSTVQPPPTTTAAPVVTLTSAINYNKVFQGVNKTFWAGSSNIFPVQLLDGRKLWISGLSWPGPLTSSYVRPGTPNIFNTILIESDTSVVPFGPVSSVSGYKYLFDSTQVFPSLSSASRLDPVAGIALRDALYLTVTASTTDYRSTFIYGDKYLLDIPTRTLASGAAPIRRYVKLPSYNDIYFGSGLYSFADGYLYIAGHSTTGSGKWNTYIARVLQPYLYNIESVPDNMEYFQGSGWTKTIGFAVPIITDSGQNVDITYTSSGEYNYLYKGSSGAYDKNILTLAQRSLSTPATNIRSASVYKNYSVTADSGSVGFMSPGVYDVPWANLASGNRLGMYTVAQTSSSYETSHPNFCRPHFFEYNYSQLAMITGVPFAPPVLAPPPVPLPAPTPPVVIVIPPPVIQPLPRYVAGAKVISTTLPAGPCSMQSNNFPVVAGELIVVKVATSLGDLTIQNCSGSGLAWTPRVTTPGSSTAAISRIAIYTAIAPASGNITTRIDLYSPWAGTTATFHIGRYSGAAIATNPATDVEYPPRNPSSTINTLYSNSLVSWMDSDWNAAPGGPSYLSGAIQDDSYINSAWMSVYYAHQSAASPGSQLYGLSGPGGQIPTLGAVEIIASG